MIDMYNIVYYYISITNNNGVQHDTLNHNHSQ